MAVVAVAAPAAGCGHGATATSATPPAVVSSASTGVTASATPSASSTPSPKPTATPSGFTAQISKVSRDTVKYSWHPGCPVPVSGLRLIKMTYWGMDHQPHNGQLVVNASVAGDVVTVFKKLYAGRYPIRRMELVDVYKGSDFDSIEADNTSAFNCRNAEGSSSWSQHAYGLAIDVNTCENPYVYPDGTVSHKKCVKFKDRSRRDPGVIHNGDLVVRSFRAIGWGWGGLWSGAKDYQHFSSNGR
ncbi:MAG: hypothetical protein JWL58_5490 [Streptosporangiaceae bacterium]|nr:hypothetical protein [Streptosporangiaceae bacterium]